MVKSKIIGIIEITKQQGTPRIDPTDTLFANFKQVKKINIPTKAISGETRRI